jgi:predicted nucleic acid-binding protein
MIAVDATVLADWLFNGGALRKSAIKLQGIDPDWSCVALVRYELGNVAWKLIRAGRLRSEDVVPAWLALPRAGIEIVHEVEWVEVSALAMKKEISFYDAAHVWTAMSRGIPLFSRDGPLRAKCPEVVRAMPEI